MRMELIPMSVIQLLWQRFSLKVEATPDEQRNAIKILSMIAGAEKDIIKSNLSLLVEHGLKSNNILLARDTCSAMMKLVKETKSDGDPYRLPTDHQLFTKLEELLIGGLCHFHKENVWKGFSEHALGVIFNLAEGPDIIAARILKSLVRIVIGETDKSTGETGKQV